MSSLTAVSRLPRDSADREPRRFLSYGLALTVSAALHVLVWLVRHELEERPLSKPVLMDSMEVSLMVAAPAVRSPAAEPPKTAEPEEAEPKPAPPPKPESPPRLKPKAKSEAKPKAVPKPRREPAEQAAVAVDKTPPSETVSEPEPQENALPAAGAETNPVKAERSGKSETFVEARADAAYLNNPKPDYPAPARQRFLEGRVLLRVQVMADGRCGDVRVERSSGHEMLDEAALATVKKWRFVPAKRGERAVESWVNVPIVFKLSR
jgi:protein TonB